MSVIAIQPTLCYTRPMNSMASMNVSLPSQMEGFVKDLVQEGRYSSASEVVRDGIRILRKQEEERAAKLAHIRALVKEAEDSGPSEPWDVEEIKASARAKWEAMQSTT